MDELRDAVRAAGLSECEPVVCREGLLSSLRGLPQKNFLDALKKAGFFSCISLIEPISAHENAQGS